jgi:Arc/MetJ-type ribon-helix-helix transcriptional regulator
MTILSVSITSKLEKFIDDEVASGKFESKDQFIEKALKKFEDNLVIKRILRASREAKKGKYFEGNLRELVKNIK